MTELEKAARMALEALEELQGVCTDAPGGVEAVTIWAPEAIAALTQALATTEPLTLSDEWHERAFQAAKNYVNKGDKETRTACFIAGAMWSTTTEPVADRCAQCKKAYRQNAGSTGCPKCAPGVSVSEDEFRKPIATTERKLVATPDHNGAHVPASPADMQVYNKIAAGYWTERKGEPGLFATEVQPQPLRYSLDDYHRAPSEGPLNATWQDKPHRLLYDLIAALVYYTSPQVPEDTARLDWIERQYLEDLVMCLVIGAPNDGQYSVCGDNGKPGYGKTLREAIDAARKGEQP